MERLAEQYGKSLPFRWSDGKCGSQYGADVPAKEGRKAELQRCAEEQPRKTLKQVQLGNQEVSEIMLGLMRIDTMEEDGIFGLLNAALEAEINCLDIADVYGDGVCEEKLGAVFSAHPSLRDQFFLQTKCGIRKDQFLWYDFSRQYIIRQAEGSLRRMQTDYIDCLLLHRPDFLMEPEEVQEAFRILHESGKVGSFGVSNMNPLQIDLLKTGVDFPLICDQLQLSAAFTPAVDAGFNVNMKNEAAVVRASGILEYCRIHNMVVQAWSPLQYGFFGGVFVGSDQYPLLNEVLDRIAGEQEVTSDAVAVAWVLRCPGKMQAVLGTTNRSHLLSSAHASHVHLSKKQWYEIYIAAGNPLP